MPVKRNSVPVKRTCLLQSTWFYLFKNFPQIKLKYKSPDVNVWKNHYKRLLFKRPAQPWQQNMIWMWIYYWCMQTRGVGEERFLAPPKLLHTFQGEVTLLHTILLLQAHTLVRSPVAILEIRLPTLWAWPYKVLSAIGPSEADGWGYSSPGRTGSQAAFLSCKERQKMRRRLNHLRGTRLPVQAGPGTTATKGLAHFKSL